jgi:hypothetical protein
MMNNTVQATADVEAAVARLRQLIDQGWEFPDAAFKAATELRVSQRAVEAAYDAPHSCEQGR